MGDSQEKKQEREGTSSSVFGFPSKDALLYKVPEGVSEVDFEFPTPGELIVITPKKKYFRCDRDGCKLKYESKGALKRHQLNFHSFQWCRICKKKSWDRPKLDEHYKTEHNGNKFACSKCHEEFPRLAKLKKHENEMHAAAAQVPSAASQAPSDASQAPSAASQAPSAASQAPSAAPQASSAAAQAPAAAPQAPSAAPQASSAAAKAPAAAFPQAPTAAAHALAAPPESS